VADFFAYNPAFTGGVRVAVGDVNGDGVDDVITAAGLGGGPHIQVFAGVSDGNGGVASINTTTPIASFMAYDPTFNAGVFVATADLNGDGFDDIITGPARAAARTSRSSPRSTTAASSRVSIRPPRSPASSPTTPASAVASTSRPPTACWPSPPA